MPQSGTGNLRPTSRTAASTGWLTKRAENLLIGFRMPEYQFLNEQRGLYDIQSRHVDAWKAAYVEAMQCREIEDAVNLGLMILANIRRHNERWAKDIESSRIPFTWDDAESFAGSISLVREKGANCCLELLRLAKQADSRLTDPRVFARLASTLI